MPLQSESVPDPFDDATHRQLDALVNKATAGVEEFIRLTKYPILLMSIVGHSDNVLDHTYLRLDLADAYSLVNTYDGLQDK